MKAYEFRLRPQAAWSTHWHADTLWGSLCWAWLESGGPAELKKLLGRFKELKPPFVISDALPTGLLPFPVGAKPASYEEGKKMKTVWCSGNDFQKWSKGELTELPAPSEQQRPFSTRSRLHVRQNRNTGGGEEGGLFEEDEHSFNRDAFPKADRHLLSVFVRVLPENGNPKQEAELLSALCICFEMLGQKGYGRKASTGLGAFALDGDPERRDWLEITQGQTGFVSLSHFVPAKDDPREGHWKVHVKNPKFASNLVPQFLKGNLITLTAGSNFRTGGDLRAFYGRMIEMPREGFAEALHYGLAFVAPVT
jgi:CRISPR-associated protein Csm4